MRNHPRDKRGWEWFRVHCCNTVVKVGPSPVMDIAGALGLAFVGILGLVALMAMTHYLGAAGTSGILAAATVPVATEELEGQLKEILGLIKEEKTARTEVTEKLVALQKQADALDVKLAERHAAAQPQESVFEYLQKHEGLQRFLKDRPSSGFVFELSGKQAREMFERKTTVDSAAVGLATSGVLQIDRTPGIVAEARQTLQLRDVLTARPTELPAIDYVKVNSALSRASMQTESSSKVENAVTFTTASALVRTIASVIPASRQVLDDFKELFGFLQNSLPYYVNLTEEVQMLTGSNTGNDLNGLVTQGTAFNTALLSATAGWNKADQLARAIQQVAIAKEVQPTFVVLHPTDYWDILLTKDSQRRYLFADNSKPFWGLTPIPTVNIGSGNFLVGSGNPAAAEIRDRMGLQVEISTQHQDFFIKNLVMIRAEKRMALVVYRAGSFIQGSFSTSP
jgi:HK97 family phage major capsid protein